MLIPVKHVCSYKYLKYNPETDEFFLSSGEKTILCPKCSKKLRIMDVVHG